MRGRYLFVLLLGSCLALAGCDPRTGSAEAVETEPEESAGSGAVEEQPALPVTVRRAVARGGSGPTGEIPAEWVPGSVVSRHDAEIAAEVAGRLVVVGEVGDRLAAGDVVARVDDAALKLRLRADESEIRRLEARLDYLDRQLARIDALIREQIAARTQLDELTSERAMAEQTLESARVARDTTAFLVERSTLRAPFPGRVVARLAQPGGYVSAGEPVVRLVDTTHVEVSAQAPLQAVMRVDEGMTVELRASERVPGTVSGTVRAAVPVGDERSRMFEIRVRLRSDATWPVGTPVRVALPARPSGGAGARVAVPRDALILRREATYVFVVEDEDSVATARRVEVTPGAGDGEWIEVEGDVRDGDRVIVRGAERLDDGQRVKVGG